MLEGHDVDFRLENWARWSKESKPRGTSNIQPILNRMREIYGDPDETEGRSSYRPPVDAADALRVDKAISNAPETGFWDRKGVELVVLTTLQPRHGVGWYCWSTRTRPRDFNRFLNHGKTLINRELKKLDKL